MKASEFYKERHHPQYRLSEANIRMYNIILDLDVDTVFEFGCGIGRHLHRLGELGYDCTGVDISKECVNEAKDNGLNVYVGDENTLVDQNDFDLVITNSVLCHMENPPVEQLKSMASKYLLMCECVSKTNDYWWIHEYPGKELLTVDAHLDNGATYKIYLCEF